MGDEAPRPKVAKPPPKAAPVVQAETEDSRAAAAKQIKKPRGAMENLVRGNPANTSRETTG